MTADKQLALLENRLVLILGDVMIDRYLTGSVTRISPEAPVPVVLHQKTEDRLGGAANVALNIAALGSTPLLCSVAGRDDDGAALLKLLPASGISAEGILLSQERKTSVKTRVLGNNQQMLRIDQEDTHDLTQEETQLFLQQVHALLEKYPVEAIIFQDYNKGVLTQTVIENVLKAARERNIPTTVDPKKANFFAYQQVSLFKPNLKEIRDSVPFSVYSNSSSLTEASFFLKERLKNQLTMITLSENGLYLDVESGGKIYPTQQRNVADVSGAGDTVISIATLALIAGFKPSLMAALSNLAGGQVCEFPGVVPVKKDLLKAELDNWLRENEEAGPPFNPTS